METPLISGKLIAQSWEKWILSEEGKMCLETDMLKNERQKNIYILGCGFRLWLDREVLNLIINSGSWLFAKRN